MVLALGFEAFVGRSLPPAPQAKFVGGEMSLQEKGRVLRLAVTLMGGDGVGVDLAKRTHQCIWVISI